MQTTIQILLVLITCRHFIEAVEDSSLLSELPYGELLSQKKNLECRNCTKDTPVALALMGQPRKDTQKYKSSYSRRTFHYDDDEEEEKGHVSKKKKEDKMHDILNTSVMALSYLAFGGYLLCMIATALREKRRRIMMAYPTGTGVNNQLANVLQHYMAHRPVRPVIRFPSVTLHHGGKKRRSIHSLNQLIKINK